MTEQPTNTSLPEQVALMCALMHALPDHTQLRNATLKLLAAQDSSHMLIVAQQVVRLNRTAKVCGIKLLRSIFGMSLRDTKLLWEVGASLQGYDTRPNQRPNTDGYPGKPEPHPFVPE